jgi:flavin-binding protein dodecin
MTSGSTYRIVEIVGTSKTSWEEAAKIAVETAGKSLLDPRIAEVVKLDIMVEDGKVSKYRARINFSFKYHGEKVISESYKKAKIIS